MTKVLGLDLSIVATGLALPSGELFTIKPRLQGDARLVEIEDALDYYLGRPSAWPNVALIERIPTSKRGHETAIILALVHGIARKLLAAKSVPFVYIDNSTLKKYATGSGAADKRQMVHAARDRGADPADDNQADAAWLRWAGKHYYDGEASPAQHLSRDLLFPPTTKIKGWPDLARTARRHARP